LSIFSLCCILLIFNLWGYTTKRIVLFLLLSLSVFAAKDDYFLTTEWLKDNLKNENLLILDTIELEEHNGKKNYSESRNGMIPGSIHIFYKDFLDEDGLLKSKSEVKALTAERGLDTSKPIVTYSTGGIRSSMG